MLTTSNLLSHRNRTHFNKPGPGSFTASSHQISLEKTVYKNNNDDDDVAKFHIKER